MKKNNRAETVNANRPNTPPENNVPSSGISRIEQQLSQNFRELLLRALNDKKTRLDIYELEQDQYILDCEYQVKMDDEMIVPTYFVKGLGYTDGKISRQPTAKKGPYQTVAPLHQQLIIENPSIVAVLEWSMGEVSTRSFRNFMQELKGRGPNRRASRSRLQHSLQLSIFCRDKEPVSEYVGHLMLERMKRG